MADIFNEQNDILKSDINHLVRSVSGYCCYSLLDSNPSNLPDINYFKGLIKANGILTGFEARELTVDQIDEFKDESKKELTDKEKIDINQILRQVITEIKVFFSEEGKEQLIDAKEQSNVSLAKMNALDKTIKINSGDGLLSANKYFKEVNSDNLSPKETRSINSYNKNIITILDQFNKVDNLGKLITIYNEIQKVVLDVANKITNLIFSIIGDLYAILESDKVNLKLAKQKTKDLQRLATLRNEFLAPCFVIAGSLPNVETLKNKNQ